MITEISSNVPVFICRIGSQDLAAIGPHREPDAVETLSDECVQDLVNRVIPGCVYPSVGSLVMGTARASRGEIRNEILHASVVVLGDLSGRLDGNLTNDKGE